MAKKKKRNKAHHIFLVTWITYYQEDEPERTESPEMFNKAVYVTADDKAFTKLMGEAKLSGNGTKAIREWAKACARDTSGTPSTVHHGYTTITYLGFSDRYHQIGKVATKEVQTSVIEFE